MFPQQRSILPCRGIRAVLDDQSIPLWVPESHLLFLLPRGGGRLVLGQESCIASTKATLVIVRTEIMPSSFVGRWFCARGRRWKPSCNLWQADCRRCQFAKYRSSFFYFADVCFCDLIHHVLFGFFSIIFQWRKSLRLMMTPRAARRLFITRRREWPTATFSFILSSSWPRFMSWWPSPTGSG